MRLWLLLIAALVVQEVVTANAALSAAYQAHINSWIIHGLFVCASALDVWLGYRLGVWVGQRFEHGKLATAAKRHSTRIEAAVGQWGKRLILILLGFVNFIYVDAFVLAWSTVSFKEVFVFTLLGDLLWYGLAWSTVAGAHSLFGDPSQALLAVLLVSLVSMVLFGSFARKYLPKL